MEVAKCARCGADTQLFLREIPVCVACIEAEEKARERQEDPKRTDSKTKAVSG